MLLSKTVEWNNKTTSKCLLANLSLPNKKGRKRFTQQANSTMRSDENGNTNTVQRQKTLLESGKNQTLAPTHLEQKKHNNSSINNNDGSLPAGSQGEMNDGKYQY
jgi:hypothetical protein